MNTSACVVAPRDLLETILNSNQKLGWFGGLKIEREDVFVAFQCSVNNEELTSKNFRLLPHRAAHRVMGKYSQELLQWVAVEAGFQRAQAGDRTLSPEDYQTAVGIDVTGEPIYFAAIEPSEDGPVLTSRMATRLKSGRVRLRPVDSIILPHDPAPFVRLAKEVVQDLENKSVLIVGVGSGGSEIALNLACCGIGKLQLVDPDRLRPENYIRFPAGSQDLGRYKTEIIRSMIQERELPTEVAVYNVDVVRDADKFREIVPSDVDVIICATDSIASRRLVNCTAVRMHIPCVIVGTLNHGKIGEILRIEPYTSPCYECVRLELGAALEPTAEGSRLPTPYVGAEDTDLSGGALRMDITVPAALASHVTLQLLSPDRFKPMPSAYVLWGREVEKSFSDPFKFDYPFATNYVPVPRRRDCPVCGALPPELVGVDIVKRTSEILAQADEASS